MGSGDDIDPDAPAAMKDSPSVSGDDEAGEQHHHPSSVLLKLNLCMSNAQTSLSGWCWPVLHEIDTCSPATVHIINYRHHYCCRHHHACVSVGVQIA